MIKVSKFYRVYSGFPTQPALGSRLNIARRLQQKELSLAPVPGIEPYSEKSNILFLQAGLSVHKNHFQPQKRRLNLRRPFSEKPEGKREPEEGRDPLEGDRMKVEQKEVKRVRLIEKIKEKREEEGWPSFFSWEFLELCLGVLSYPENFSAVFGFFAAAITSISVAYFFIKDKYESGQPKLKKKVVDQLESGFNRIKDKEAVRRAEEKNN